MQITSKWNRTLAALAVGALTVPNLFAVTNVWSGAGGNDNWSTPANWSPGVPGLADEVFFFDDDATGSPGVWGLPNNIVDANQAIQSLMYGNTNGFHNTQIPAGSTLTVGGTTISTLYVGTGTDNGNSQTIYATIQGKGNLLITNTAGSLVVIQGSQTSGGSKAATLDMEGLDTFTAYVSQIRVAAEGGNSGKPYWNRPDGTLILARTNVIYATGNPGLQLSRTGGNGGPGRVLLGQTNAIFSDNGIGVGSRKSPAGTKLSFNSNFIAPTALFRDETGTGRQGLWTIGDESENAGGSASSIGEIDFTGGTVDALVDTILLGRGSSPTGTGPGIGTLTFGPGTVDANTVDLGVLLAVGGTGTINVNSGGLLIVNDALRFAPAGGTCEGTLNVTGGTARINAITNGGALVAAINVNSGNLVLTNSGGNPESPILNFLAVDATISIAVNPGAPSIYVASLDVTGLSTNNTINILSLPPIGGYPAQFPLVSYVGYTPLTASDFLVGTLPSTFVGYISNNTVNSTLDLVITGGPAPVRELAWRGNVNGNWDTTTTNWLGTNLLATTYNQGDFVTFNDSASGSTTVNLTTSLSPISLTVNNSAKTYTFTGSGSLDGAVGLVKDGSASLILANSGLNTFAGAVTLLGGVLQLAGSADRLPVNCTVTLADVSGTTLDLNNLNQSIGSLSGGGASGGNVSLGSGTLSITGDTGNHAGVISGSGQVVKAGPGTQVLSGGNLYTGGTVVNEGTLAVANTAGSGVGSGYVFVASSNATFSVGAGGPEGAITATTITNQGTVLLDRSADFTLTQLITGDGGLRKNNINTVTLATANTYTNETVIDGGALRISHPGALGTTDGQTFIDNTPDSRLELVGGITLLEQLDVAMKQSDAGDVPCVVNVSGNNTLAGPILAGAGGSFWRFRVDADKLTVSGSFTNTTDSSPAAGRRLVLQGAGTGDWQSSIGNRIAPASVTAVIKEGDGTWTLSGANTYTGDTTISGGTLLVNGAIRTGAVNVNAGTLGGTGLILGPVTTLPTPGILSPGDSGFGTLTISNNVSLFGTTIMEVAHAAHDQVRGVNTLQMGGMLEIVVAGTLTGGEVFKLFEATSYTGSFFYILPTLPSPLAWDDSMLAIDGTLKITGGAPTLDVSRTGNTLTFAWTEPGFKLQAQTNSISAGLGNTWFDYPGGTVSGVTANIDPAAGTVFFRLISTP